MLSYHGDPELKRRAVESAKQHREQDMLIAGAYTRMNGSFRGCSVGCDAYEITQDPAFNGRNPHEVTAEYYGLPVWLEHLRDVLFEGLPKKERRNFHVQLKQAIPVGVDLEPLQYKLAIKRIDRLIAALPRTEKELAAMQQVRACHKAALTEKGCSLFDKAQARQVATAVTEWAAMWSVVSIVKSSSESAWHAVMQLASQSELSTSDAWKQEVSDLFELLGELSEDEEKTDGP